MAAKRVINIALLGLGKLGTGFLRVLQDKQTKIKEETGFEIRLKKILVKNPHFKRARFVDTSLLTTEVEDIIADKSIDIAVDAIGGIEPTFTIIKSLISNKVHIVSANRALLASKMHDLANLANRNKIYILPEPSLGGGIPIISAIQRDLIANQIKIVIGILSGTSNFILSEMSKNSLSLTEALQLPQIQEIAESLSVIDYEGSDAAQKVSIIAAAAFGIDLGYLHIHAEGIAEIDTDDVRYASDLGFEIKLLAIIKDHQDKYEIRVHPTLVPKDHPLISVKGRYNAFLIETDLIGNYMLYGKGVGIEATSSVIIRDIVEIANLVYHSPRKGTYRPDWNDKPVMPIEEIRSSYYVRFPCHDKPGVIGSIATILGNFNINIGSAHAEVDMDSPSKQGFVHILIDDAMERDVKNAIEEISKQDLVRDRIKFFRIL
ncbi:MAG: homoserine dehydrogenase [Calditrichaceae bacterium]|jgi:homoserine dehydrogenase